MANQHSLRCYDYVNQPFAQVQAALLGDAAAIFKRATTSAAEREYAIGVQLHARVGVLEVSADVRIEVGTVEHTKSSPYGYEMTVFPLSWKAISRPSLFPHMQSKMLVYPLSGTETQLELEGIYNPPLGLLGDAIDAVAGHRIAEASVLRFVQDVAALLRAELR